MQMNVSITPEMREYVLGKVKSGRYSNASEVIRDSLRRMSEAEATESSWRTLNGMLAGAEAGGRSKRTVAEMDVVRHLPLISTADNAE